MPVATLEAARKNKSRELSELLTPDNVNATDGRSWTALHKACWAGNATCVAEILKHGGADLELRTNRSGGGDTALEMAVWNGLGCNSGSISGGAHDYVGCVILLVTAGAIMTEGAWKHLATEFHSEKHQDTADMMIGAWACIARDDADFTGNAPTPPPASPTPPTPQTEMTTSTAIVPFSQTSGTRECNTCHEDMNGKETWVILPCRHARTCRGCIDEWQRTGGPTCPECRQPIKTLLGPIYGYW